MDHGNQSLHRSALIAYGSETGNAYDYAEELGRILERLHFWTHVSKLNGIDPASRSHFSILIVIVSTTGQGDLPNNARLFWKGLLRRKLPPKYLDGVQFTTFGLGDSSYPKFNWACRKLHKRLVQLGAKDVYLRAEADEQHDDGLDASFVPWSRDLRQHLLTRFPLAEGIYPISEHVLLPPRWMLEAADQNLSPTQNCIPDGVGNGLITGGHREAPVNGHTVYPTGTEHKPLNANITSDSTIQAIAVSLVENRRLTPETHWQDVRHLSFTSQTPASYGAGDVLTIYPKNSSGDVDQLLSRMSWIDMADRPIRLKPTGVIHEKIPYPASPISLPRPITTLRNLLAEHLDLTAIPRRSFFSLIAHFTENKFQKDRLVEFTKPEYIDELYDYTTRPKRSILEVLQEFESVMIPWQWAANVLPELRGRQFSIASGGQLKNELDSSARFELLVAIVKYKTFIKKIREGVCTRYLAALPVGTELRVGLQKGGLAITETEMKRPVIMIGPGTGVAPMRSLIWERLRWAEEHRPDAAGQVVGHPNGTDTAIKNVLFFGGRNKNADFFYSTEWASLQGQMPLAVYPAFSRDQDSKVYVQDRIKEQADLVFSLLHEAGGFVYVCGSSGKMPQAVRAALVDVFQDRGNMDQEAANKYLEGMEKVGRYKQETW